MCRHAAQQKTVNLPQQVEQAYQSEAPSRGLSIDVMREVLAPEGLGSSSVKAMLHGIGNLQQASVAEGRADKLDADRKATRILAARQRHGGFA